MTGSVHAGLAAALLTCACELDTFGIRDQEQGVVIIDTYEREFRWTEPRPCTVFLRRRVTDQDSRLVEYDARIGGRELSVTYSVDPDAERPLAARVFDERGTPILTVEADGHDLAVHDAARADLVNVSGYDGPRLQAVVDVDAALEDPDAVALLQCALPLRAELGAVPPFLLNREAGGRVPGNPDLSSSPTEQRPLLDPWDSRLTLLGAFTRLSVCPDRDGFACPCFRVRHPTAGEIAGWCEPVRRPPAP